MARKPRIHYSGAEDGGSSVTVQQHHIFGRSARLTYTVYAAPVRVPKSAALPNGYRPGGMPGSRPPGERFRQFVFGLIKYQNVKPDPAIF